MSGNPVFSGVSLTADRICGGDISNAPGCTAQHENASKNAKQNAKQIEADLPPDLRTVIDSWATLPAPVRLGIMAMVKASQGNA